MPTDIHFCLKKSFWGECISLFVIVAQKKLDQEIKERDEKYSELDSKFNRLHKRAKQRIQEVQKVNIIYGIGLALSDAN